MSEHATKETLSCLIDGQLREDQRLAAEAHLAACNDCRARLKDLRGVSQLLASLPRAQLPAGFMSRLRRRQSENAPAPAPSTLWRAPLRTAAFALAGFFAVMTSYELLKKSPDSLSGAVSDLSEAQPPASAARAKTRAQAPGAPLELSEFREEPAPKIAAAAGAGAAGVKSESVSPPAKPHTNETLYKELEKETQRMGIVKVLPRYSGNPESNYSRWQGITGGNSLMMTRSASPAPLKGKQPALLTNTAESALAPGSSLVSPIDEDPLEDGVAVRTQEALGILWNRLERPGKAPQADFKKEMLLFILGGGTKSAVEFTSIKEVDGRIQVLYNESENPSASFYPYRAVPRSDLPVEFQKAP